MPHISKTKLKQKTFLKINTLLIDSLFSKSAGGNGKNVLKSLLTKTERVMLAKRLAVIVLLDRSYSIYRIAKSLKVSPSTVARIKEDMTTKYGMLCKQTQGKRMNDFLNKLEKFFVEMPPRVGKGRWKFLFEK